MRAKTAYRDLIRFLGVCSLIEWARQDSMERVREDCKRPKFQVSKFEKALGALASRRRVEAWSSGFSLLTNSKPLAMYSFSAGVQRRGRLKPELSMLLAGETPALPGSDDEIEDAGGLVGQLAGTFTKVGKGDALSNFHDGFADFLHDAADGATGLIGAGALLIKPLADTA
jgi:hypothetical protein